VTNDEQIARRLRMLRVHGSEPKYFHRLVGGNFRLDALQAAVLRVEAQVSVSLDKCPAGQRRSVQEAFKEAGLDEVGRSSNDTPGHTYNQFVIRVDRRDALRAFLLKRDVETEVYYPLPLHLQECFRGLGYRKGDFPALRACASESLALPIYPGFLRRNRSNVVSQFQKFFLEGERDIPSALHQQTVSTAPSVVRARPLRVLYVMNTAAPSGSVRSLLLLVKSLPPGTVEPCVVCPDGYAVQLLEDAHIVGRTIPGVSMFWSIRAAPLRGRRL